MWKKLSNHFVITFISIFFILFVMFPYCGERIASKLVFNDYINKTFGILGKELDVKYKGRFVEETIRGVHGDIIRWWISGYRVNAPFMSKPFEVWVDKRNYKIFGDNFYDTLQSDEKFQHLYSNWVKKQIGINDPNVELKFDRARCGSRNIGDDIHIDFSKIKDTNSINEQICENIKNIYIKSNTFGDPGVIIKTSEERDIKDNLNYADKIESKIRDKVFIDNNHFTDREKNCLFINISNKEDKLTMAIRYDYDENCKEFLDYSKEIKTNWERYK